MLQHNVWVVSAVLKVGTVQRRRLSCLKVLGDRVNKIRMVWCLVRINGVAAWSRMWRRSKRWTHMLQRLDDWCPGLFSLWLTRDMYGVWEDFGRCCLLISDSVSFFLPRWGVFLSVKAAKGEKGRKAEREDIFSISTLFHLDFHTDALWLWNVFLDYLLDYTGHRTTGCNVNYASLC